MGLFHRPVDGAGDGDGAPAGGWDSNIPVNSQQKESSYKQTKN
jgi:hypothetical protein